MYVIKIRFYQWWLVKYWCCFCNFLYASFFLYNGWLAKKKHDFWQQTAQNHRKKACYWGVLIDLSRNLREKNLFCISFHFTRESLSYHVSLHGSFNMFAQMLIDKHGKAPREFQICLSLNTQALFWAGFVILLLIWPNQFIYFGEVKKLRGFCGMLAFDFL